MSYLANVRDFEVDTLSIKSFPMVSKIIEMFPNDLPTMPLDRYIYIFIDLDPGTHPISIPPYIMVPIELRELKVKPKSSSIRDLFILVLPHGIVHC